MERFTPENTNTSGTSINLNDERAVIKQCLLICEDAKACIESLVHRESTLLQEAPQNTIEDNMRDFKAKLLTLEDGSRDSLGEIIVRLRERLEFLLNEDPDNSDGRIRLQNEINISKQCLDVCKMASEDGNRHGLADTIGCLQERLESLLNEDPENDNERLRLQNDINISKQCLDVCKVASEVSHQKIYRIGEVIADSDSDSVVVTTLADLFDVKKVPSKGNSAAVLGSMTEETLRHLIDKPYGSRFGAVGASDSVRTTSPSVFDTQKTE
ncbi:hypothetical protein VE00_05047 [Pseudogymnoascus sp. WSF 3629]|nr:hypothetical protein VE00_05047 [Pseudogymnoascus sp. WSF 3629]